MEKSYVTLEQKICVVCTKEYDTNALLLDKRLKPRFDMHTTTGFGMCPEHEKMAADGYVALVACDPERSTVRDNHTKPQDAYRTGRLAHLKLDAFRGLFGQEPPENLVCFCDDELIDKLEQMEKRSRDGDK
jgi:hypothetical protein